MFGTSGEGSLMESLDPSFQIQAKRTTDSLNGSIRRLINRAYAISDNMETERYEFWPDHGDEGPIPVDRHKDPDLGWLFIDKQRRTYRTPY